MKMKKALKITRNILLVILACILLFLVITFTYDRISRKKELKMLTELGYINPVSVGGYSLNVCIYGSEKPEHNIVGMSGLGVFDFSCTGRYVTDAVSDKNRIIFVDRAGYGASDDTSVPQTIDRIIDDYRNALKNAGIEAPYILMPHSVAGPYAAYWAAKYPDEIEGIFFLDGTQLNGTHFEEFGTAGLDGQLEIIAGKLGLGRIYTYFFEKDIYNLPRENDLEASLALHHLNGRYTKALNSESGLEGENMITAWNNINSDVRKMYICSSCAMETPDDMMEYIDFMSKISGKKPPISDEKLEEYCNTAIDEIVKFRHEYVDVFCETAGNCEIRLISGDHMIYCHKPDEVSKCLTEFLDELDAEN